MKTKVITIELLLKILNEKRNLYISLSEECEENEEFHKEQLELSTFFEEKRKQYEILADEYERLIEIFK